MDILSLQLGPVPASRETLYAQKGSAPGAFIKHRELPNIFIYVLQDPLAHMFVFGLNLQHLQYATTGFICWTERPKYCNFSKQRRMDGPGLADQGCRINHHGSTTVLCCTKTWCFQARELDLHISRTSTSPKDWLKSVLCLNSIRKLRMKYEGIMI